MAWFLRLPSAMKLSMSEWPRKSRRWALGSLGALLVASTLIVGWPASGTNRPSSDTPPAPSAPAPSRASEPRPGAERARVIRNLHERTGEQSLALVDEKIRKDPTYARTLKNTTRESVWKLKSLSKEEKVVLWERIQRAQTRLPKTP